MTRSILQFLIFFQVLSPFANSQKLRKADKEIISELQTDIGSLSNDKMEGRRSGTSGEAMASEYIIGGFYKSRAQTIWEIAELIFNDLKFTMAGISRYTRFSINNADLILNTEFIPLPFSASGKADGSPAIALQESGSPWFYDLKETVEAAQSNPHFDMDKLLREKTRLFEGKGATAVIFYNSSKTDDGIVFDPAEGIKPEKIPVLYVTKTGKEKIPERYFTIPRCADRCTDD